jgi:broad specificity phosphatase PhoE
MAGPGGLPHLPQARRVILVRHARPRTRPRIPAPEWELSEEGQAAARRLAALGLFEHATSLYSGPEPKMQATLASVAEERGLAVQSLPEFAESRVGGWLDQGPFLAAAGRYLSSPDQPAAPGWETASAVATRFSAAIERLCGYHPPVVHPGHINPGTFAVVSGGRALSAYLAVLFAYPAEQTFQLWRTLRMPDVAVVELAPDAPPRLVIPFGALLAG